MINVIYHEKVEKDRLPKVATAVVHLFCVEITDIKSCAKTLIGEITDTSWISQLDPVGKMAYENTARRTIEELVKLFQTVENKVTADFGEYMISLSSGRCLKEKHSHICLPLAELWKEKVSNNHGFDFHTMSPADKFSFGESKFLSSGNAYPAAAEQVHRFSREGKDMGDAVNLAHFGSDSAMQNLLKNKKGYVVAFSINSDDHELILSNSLQNDDVKCLTERCDELYIIGVKV